MEEVWLPKRLRSVGHEVQLQREGSRPRKSLSLVVSLEWTMVLKAKL